MLDLLFVVAVTATTVWAVTSHRLRERDPDSTFWYAFAGLCCLLPALIVPAASHPLAGAFLLAIAVLVGAATTAATQYSNLQHSRRSRFESRTQAQLQLISRHDAVLACWRAYELDAAKLIDYPAMSDVRVPETALLVRAMDDADRLRVALTDPLRGEAFTKDYAQAITHLESAFIVAELTATHTPTSA